MSSTGNASGSASGVPSGNASGSPSGSANGKSKSILSTLTFGLLGKENNSHSAGVANASKSKKNKNGNESENKGNQTATPAYVGPAQGGMRGGMASVSYSTPYGMRQPSEEVMKWATTAGAETPTGPQMRNVAHGGKRRRTHKRKTHRHRKSKRSTGGRKCTMKRKTHRRRHGNKRSRRHSRRN